MKHTKLILLTLLTVGVIGIAHTGYAATSKTPSPPRSTVVKQQGSGFLVSWKKPLRHVDGYKIYRSNTKKISGEVITTIGNSKTYSFVDSSVQPNIKYYYTVRSFLKTGVESVNKTQVYKLMKIPRKVVAPLPPQPQQPVASTVLLSASSASINQGQSATLTWSSTNANICVASRGWDGNKSLSGSQSITPDVTTIYTLSCTGEGGSVSRQVTITVTLVQQIPDTCYFDSKLKIGAFVPAANNTVITDTSVTVNVASTASQCKQNAVNAGYRFSEYYKTESDFALVCTDPCSINDTGFLDAFFEGIRKGVDALKDGVGYLPKKKMEFHAGQDGDCFAGGYGDHPSGATAYGGSNTYVCSSDYYWYLASQHTDWQRDLNYERSIQSQTLTIHEPIHQIFFDYGNLGPDNEPQYKIQEAFCKGVSLAEVGTVANYGDSWFTGGQYSLTNLPPESDSYIYNFLIYSLNNRFGFDIGPKTRQFFDLYKNDTTIYANGDERVKALLDRVLNQDTKQSFIDVGITVNN